MSATDITTTSKKTVEVYVQHQGRRIFVLETCKNTLDVFSATAARQMAKYKSSFEVQLGDIDPKAARAICSWLNAISNGKGKHALSTSYIGETSTIPELADLYNALDGFGIKVNDHGDDVLNALLAAFTTADDIKFNDFKAVITKVAFDSSVINKLKDEVVRRQLLAEISYASSTGIFRFCEKNKIIDDMMERYNKQKADLLAREDGQEIWDAAEAKRVAEQEAMEAAKQKQ